MLADAAVLNDRTTKILRYISAYNNQEVEDMIIDFAEDIQFININNGSHSVNTNINTIINEPIDKVIELYERKLQTLKAEIIQALRESK